MCLNVKRKRKSAGRGKNESEDDEENERSGMEIIKGSVRGMKSRKEWNMNTRRELKRE